MRERTRLFFALSGLFLLGSLIAAAIAENRLPWRDYQEQYAELAAKRATTDAMRQAAANMDIEIQQNYLPRLHRVDRCVSCHLGVENPQMRDAAQPFTLHPGDYLVTHPPERFGCTVCHQGQGRATNARAAHGHVDYWERPMLPKELLEATCGRCHREEKIPGADALTRGRELLGELGCRGCHLVDGSGGSVGPSLTDIADRDMNGDHRVDAKDWQWHLHFLRAPESLRAGTLMPNYGLEESDLRALVAWLLSLSREEIHHDYIAVEASSPVRSVPSASERGHRLWRLHGCAGCHGKAGAGGIKNLNAQGGEIPPLAMYAGTIVDSEENATRLLALIEEGFVGEKAFDGGEEDWLKPFRDMRAVMAEGMVSEKENPALPEPPIAMPPWRNKLSDQEIDDVIAYIFSLYPADGWEDDWDDEEEESESTDDENENNDD